MLLYNVSQTNVERRHRNDIYIYDFNVENNLNKQNIRTHIHIAILYTKLTCVRGVFFKQDAGEAFDVCARATRREGRWLENALHIDLGLWCAQCSQVIF